MNRKKINFVLIALMMGTCFAFASNNPFKKASRYYFYNGSWHTEAPAPEDELACNPTDHSRICSAEFPSAPTTSNNLKSNNTSASVIVDGNYQ